MMMMMMMMIVIVRMLQCYHVLRFHVIVALVEENSCIHIPQAIETEETVPGDERGISSVECEYGSSRRVDDGGH